jgi:hypothetical protein
VSVPTTPGAGLWRRWVIAASLGETLGFLVPVFAVVVGADGWDARSRYLALVVAGAGEGAVLGAAQSRVLRLVLRGFSPGAWTLRTAFAAALAWAIGLAPSESAGTWQGWPVVAQVAVAVPAGLLLLGTIGTAQWTVLRRFVHGAARLTAVVGALAASLMALAMAAITGWGLVQLVSTPPRGESGCRGTGPSALSTRAHSAPSL